VLIETKRPPARGVLPSSIGFKNAVYIQSGENPITKYDWLKSASRDTQMGAASAINRRVLVLTPGQYTLTATWTLDTDYIDVMGSGAAPDDIVVTRATGGNTVVQTADDVRLSGFTIRNTGNANGDNGFSLNADDNSSSIYRFMRFRQTNVTAYRHPVTSETGKDINGLWEFCKSDSFGWLAEGGELSGTFRFCEAGYTSFSGHGCTGITGQFEFCKGGDASFGGSGCTTADITGTFYYCTGGDGSFGAALGAVVLFSGRAIGCVSGYGSFGGRAGGVMNGYCQDCVADYHNQYGSFGTGVGNTMAGVCVNCRIGTLEEYKTGIRKSLASGTVGPVKATLTLSWGAGPQNRIKLTAVDYGIAGNDISVTTVDTGSLTIAVSGLDITVNINEGTTTSQQVEDAINADADASLLVLASAAVGSPTAAVKDNLEDGLNYPSVRHCHPYVPTACIASAELFVFDSGHTFSNAGAEGAVTLTLPAAIPGLEYSFLVEAVQELRIDPSGSETIALANGVQQGAGKYITANADGEGCKLVCRKMGQWEHFDSVGTWTVEA